MKFNLFVYTFFGGFLFTAGVCSYLLDYFSSTYFMIFGFLFGYFFCWAGGLFNKSEVKNETDK